MFGSNRLHDIRKPVLTALFRSLDNHLSPFLCLFLRLIRSKLDDGSFRQERNDLGNTEFGSFLNNELHVLTLRHCLCKRDGTSQRLGLRRLKVFQANGASINFDYFGGNFRTAPVEYDNPGPDAEPQHMKAVMRLAAIQSETIQRPLFWRDIKTMRTHPRKLSEKVLRLLKEALMHRTIIFS